SNLYVKDVYTDLIDNEAVIINDSAASTQRVLKRQDIFQILSERKGGHNE
ncbi:ABC transporter ATP-binding protein, partial [Mammaliicoccus sciuri]